MPSTDVYDEESRTEKTSGEGEWFGEDSSLLRVSSWCKPRDRGSKRGGGSDRTDRRTTIGVNGSRDFRDHRRKGSIVRSLVCGRRLSTTPLKQTDCTKKNFKVNQLL